MSVHDTKEQLRERKRRQAQSRRQRQTDVLRTKDGHAWRPIAEIGTHNNRSVAQAAKDIFDEAVIHCIEDVGFSYEELAARLQHIKRAGLHKPPSEAA